MTCWILWGLLILVFYTMESKSDRPVVNTTCLELAKPSNQPLRLTCQPGYYHCLLDENYNREFEVCREWKWIPGGKCAYFNSYGNGNVDERVCQQQPNLTCSPGGQQFSSADNTKYTACYVKKATTPAVPSTTSSSQVTGIHDRENSTASPGKSEESSHVKMQALASVLGVFVPVLILSFCVIYFVFIHPKRSHHKKDAENTGKCEEDEEFGDALSSPHISPSLIRKGSIGNAEEKIPLTGTQAGEERAQDGKSNVEANKTGENTSDRSDKTENHHLDKESVKKSEEWENNKTDSEDPESGTGKKSDSKDAQTPKGDAYSQEQQPLISKSGNAEEKIPLTGTQDGEEGAQADKSNVEANKSGENTSDHSEKSGAIPQEKESVKESEERENNKTDTEGTNPVTETCNDDKGSQVNSIVEVNKAVENTSEYSEQTKNVHQDKESVKKSEEKKEKDADNTNKCEEEEEFDDARSSPYISPSTIRKGAIEYPECDNASDAESTRVFDDTAESLKTEVQTTDKREMEQCQELYDLLVNEGWELTQGVLRLVITRNVGKTPEELVTDETTKKKLKTILPEDSLSFPSTQRDNVTSISVLYGLIRLTPGIEPKSGWGEPVKGSDTGISDDVERLYRIFGICKGISNPLTITVKDYERLLNIMLKAVTRLDCDGELKDKCKVLVDKLKAIIDPNWLQSMSRTFKGLVKR